MFGGGSDRQNDVQTRGVWVAILRRVQRKNANHPEYSFPLREIVGWMDQKTEQRPSNQLTIAEDPKTDPVLRFCVAPERNRPEPKPEAHCTSVARRFRQAVLVFSIRGKHILG